MLHLSSILLWNHYALCRAKIEKRNKTDVVGNPEKKMVKTPISLFIKYMKDLNI